MWVVSPHGKPGSHGTGGVCHSMKTSPKLTGPPLQAGVDGLAEGNQLG